LEIAKPLEVRAGTVLAVGGFSREQAAKAMPPRKAREEAKSLKCRNCFR